MSTKSAMEKDEIIPDVISTPPKNVLEISYSGGITVKEGIELTPTQVKDPPKLKWNAEPNTLYLICMTDPDAPSRKQPKYREWHHWLVGNIKEGDISKGDTLSEYIGSGPPKGTGLHRYVFLVYKQPGQIKFTEKKLSNNSGKDRGGFSIKKFAKKYKLDEPVAGNYFQAKYDDYVAELQKKLRG